MVAVVDSQRLYAEFHFYHGFQSLKVEHVVVNYQDVYFVGVSALGALGRLLRQLGELGD